MDIKIRIVPNPLYGTPGSLVENPYMAEVIHTGTATAADVCEACKEENPQMTEPLASLATETIMDYGSDRVVTDVVRFNLGGDFFTLEPAVSGSVPTLDAALTDANERYIKVVNGPSLNARIAALRPVIVGDDLGDVQFHSTEAAHDGKDWKNVLFGGEEFVALGKRLGGEGQRMELVGADGAVVSEAAFVEGDALGQRFRYRLATPPDEDFDGRLVLTSTGKDTPDASPKTITVKVGYRHVEPEPLVTSSDGFVKVKSIDEDPVPALGSFTVRGENVGYKSSDPDHGLPDHGLMGATATVGGQSLSWHCTAFDDEHAPEATFQSDGSAEELEPGEYTAALTLNYAVDDGTGVSHLEPLVIENVKFTVGE